MGPDRGPSKPVDSMTTDEKAAAATSLFPKKHLLWVVPLISLGVLTTAILNVRRLKEFVESYLPSYIDLIRKHHGFQEEDLEEEVRIHKTLLSNSQPVDVKVTLTTIQGKAVDTLEMKGVSGSQSLSELLAMIQDAPQVREKTRSNSEPLLLALSFNDSPDTELCEKYHQEVSHIEKVAAGKYHEALKEDADRAYVKIPNGVPSFQSSQWYEQSPTSHAALRKRRAELLGLNSPQSAPRYQALTARYTNASAEFIDSIYTYIMTAGGRVGASTKPRILQTIAKSATASQRAALNWTPSPKLLRQEQIASLQTRIDVLRVELKSSQGGLVITREIDSIQADIDRLQRQINTLQTWF